MTANENLTSRDDVVRDCTVALRELLDAAANEFGVPPHHELHLPFWTPSEAKGNWERREWVTDELDAHPIFLWHVGKRSTSQSWQRAAATLQSYVDERQIAPVAMRVKHYGDQLLWTYAQAYLEQELSFRFALERASTLATNMLDVLDAPRVAVTSILVLEGFAATEPFDLRPGIRIRPIAQEEVRELAQLSAGGFGLPGIAEVIWPHTDWWVAHFAVQSRRATNADLTEVNDRRDALYLALRAFKEGGGRFRHGYTKADSPFEAFGTSWGGGLESAPSGLGGSAYALSSSELPEFVSFWSQFDALRAKPRHYLQLPVRRLHIAGARMRQEDSLVDLVIGLEALLGTSDERTELGYRFRVRGAVVLTPDRHKRRAAMRELQKLYNLRSRVVHGEGVDATELADALPYAERALRKVWKWYFANYPNARDNRAGIARIDGELLGP